MARALTRGPGPRPAPVRPRRGHHLGGPVRLSARPGENSALLGVVALGWGSGRCPHQVVFVAVAGKTWLGCRDSNPNFLIQSQATASPPIPAGPVCPYPLPVPVPPSPAPCPPLPSRLGYTLGSTALSGAACPWSQARQSGKIRGAGRDDGRSRPAWGPAMGATSRPGAPGIGRQREPPAAWCGQFGAAAPGGRASPWSRERRGSASHACAQRAGMPRRSWP
jgi:hypothetical protein